VGLHTGEREQNRRPTDVHEPHGYAMDDGCQARKAKADERSTGTDLHAVWRHPEKQHQSWDKTSPAIPIGPHWMITWPFDAAANGLPTTVRDKGDWVMFAGTPYAYLHICGSPWEGNEYHEGDKAVWTMSYAHR
jgi:hypothetical protein